MSDEAVFTELNFGSFRMSPQVDQLFTALSEAQKKFGTVVKDKTANIKSDKGQYSYSYADLGSVLDATRSLADNGICVMQPPSTSGSKVTVCTVLGHKSGQWFASDLELNAAQGTPQGIGSAITYARRYALSAMLGIASEADDDGAAASHRAPAVKSLPQAVPAPASDTITDAQKKRMFALATKSGLDTKRVKEIVGQFGYEHSSEIKKSDYDKICHELEQAALGVSFDDLPGVAHAN